MLIEAAFLPYKLSSHLKLKKSNEQFYSVSVSTLVILFYYRSGTVINYGSDSCSGRTRLWLRLRQKVTAPTVPVTVLQHWL